MGESSYSRQFRAKTELILGEQFGLRQVTIQLNVHSPFKNLANGWENSNGPIVITVSAISCFKQSGYFTPLPDCWEGACLKRPVEYSGQNRCYTISRVSQQSTTDAV